MRDGQLDKRLIRSEILRGIRAFFHERGFTETDTPALVLSPGMEPHIRPMRVENGRAFLPTSPEFAMKRLLADGMEKIFQICKAWRWEPPSATHVPEFTILEWYRAKSGYEAIMEDVEELFAALARQVHGCERFESAAGPQDVSRPWPRLTVEECFRRFAGLELSELLSVEKLARACLERGWSSRDDSAPEKLSRPGAWDDFFFRVMLNAVEPGLARLGRPAIIHRYPESQAALANTERDERGLRWSRRFEVYAGGLELGNAFDELTDPAEQRGRFEKDMALRRELYGEQFPTNPIDERLLSAIGRMPPSGGIAMGVDRLVMYLTGAREIGEVLWLLPDWG